MKFKKIGAAFLAAAVAVNSLALTAFAIESDITIVAEVDISIDATKKEVTNQEVNQTIGGKEQPIAVQIGDIVTVTYTTPAADTGGSEIYANGVESIYAVEASVTNATAQISIAEKSDTLKISAKRVKISKIKVERSDWDKNQPTAGVSIKNVKIATGAKTLSAADKATYEANAEQIKSIKEAADGSYILTTVNGANFTNITGKDAPIALCIEFDSDPHMIKWNGKDIDYDNEKKAANEFAGTTSKEIINFWTSVEKGSTITATYTLDPEWEEVNERDLTVKVVEESPYETDEGGSDKPAETTTEAVKPSETTTENTGNTPGDDDTPAVTTNKNQFTGGSSGHRVTVNSDNTTDASSTEVPADVVTAANGESVEAPADVVPSGATLEVKEETKEEAVKAVEAVTATEENKEVVETVKKAVEEDKAAVVEIDLVKDGVKVQPSGTIKVTINVPAALKDAAKLFVYRVEADGTFTDVKAAVVDGKIIFSTSHFSTYIITSEALSGGAVVTEATEAAPAATEAPATTPAQTDDKNQNTGVVLAIVPAIIAAAGVVVSKKRK